MHFIRDDASAGSDKFATALAECASLNGVSSEFFNADGTESGHALSVGTWHIACNEIKQKIIGV
jgi:hypothetical protein